MTRLLRQSTAKTLRIGPFVDSDAGVDAETGLTIAQADIKISKDGGAFAQTSGTSPTTTHDADGWYQIPLSETDTATLGPLVVQIVMSGALPVWEDFLVIPANVYDSIVLGTDYLDVAALQLIGTTLTEDAAGRLAAAMSTWGNVASPVATAATVNQTGDSFARIGANGAGLSAVPWNASWDAEVQSECADAITAAGLATSANMATVLGHTTIIVQAFTVE